jgi:hypothetical protein
MFTVFACAVLYIPQVCAVLNIHFCNDELRGTSESEDLTMCPSIVYLLNPSASIHLILFERFYAFLHIQHYSHSHAYTHTRFHTHTQFTHNLSSLRHLLN